MLIYIDTDSGTWGVAESNLVIFDADGTDLAFLDGDLSDSEIIDFGKARVPDCGNPGPDCAEHNGAPSLRVTAPGA
jgi:hypothetical protein